MAVLESVGGPATESEDLFSETCFFS